jgi:hypothetical protein
MYPFVLDGKHDVLVVQFDIALVAGTYHGVIVDQNDGSFIRVGHGMAGWRAQTP